MLQVQMVIQPSGAIKLLIFVSQGLVESLPALQLNSSNLNHIYYVSRYVSVMSRRLC